MKNINKLFAIAIVILGFSATSFAQNTVTKTATASGTIVTPLTLTNTSDMKFGNIVVNAAGSVTLASNNTPTYTGVIAFAQPGTISAAHFDVTGTAGYLCTVTIPASTVVRHTDGVTEMTVTNFNSNITGTSTTGTATLDVDGKQTIDIGAKLNVNAAQKAGTYTSDNFDVTVAYQ